MRRLLPLALLTIGALFVLATPADAAKPDRQTIEVDETFFDSGASEICGFPIETSNVGTVKLTLFNDADGNLQRVFQRIDISSTFTNLETGAMIFAPNVGANIHVDIGGADDGRNLIRITGLEGQLIIPGVGSVAQDAGQTVLAGLPGTMPTLISQNGHFEGGGGPFPGGCQYLG